MFWQGLRYLLYDLSELSMMCSYLLVKRQLSILYTVAMRIYLQRLHLTQTQNGVFAGYVMYEKKGRKEKERIRTGREEGRKRLKNSTRKRGKAGEERKEGMVGDVGEEEEKGRGQRRSEERERPEKNIRKKWN